MRLLFVFLIFASFAFAESDHVIPRGNQRPVMVGPSARAGTHADIVSLSLGGPVEYSGCSATVLGSADASEPPSFVLAATHCGSDSTTGFFTTPGSNTRFPVKCFPNPQYASGGAEVDVMLCAIEESVRRSVANEMRGERSCFARADLENAAGKQTTVCGYGFPHHTQVCMEHSVSELRRGSSGGDTYLFSNTFGVHETRSGDSGASFHIPGKNGVKLIYGSLSGSEGRGGRQRDTAPSVTSQAARSYFDSVLRQFPGKTICRGEESGDRTSPSKPAPPPAPPTPPTEATKFTITGAEPDSLAELLEVRAGDQLISLNGRRPKTIDAIRRRVATLLRKPERTEIVLKVLRNGKEVVLRTKVTEEAHELCVEDNDCRLGIRLER